MPASRSAADDNIQRGDLSCQASRFYSCWIGPNFSCLWWKNHRTLTDPPFLFIPLGVVLMSCNIQTRERLTFPRQKILIKKGRDQRKLVFRIRGPQIQF